MNREKYLRQTLIYDPTEMPNSKVVIVGLGNIGSHTALLLARLGIDEIHLYDPDKVEIHNTASQAYSERDLGKNKVSVIHEKILDINPECNVSSVPKKFDGKERSLRALDVLVIGVDTMKERKKIHKGMVLNYRPRLIIDGRIGGNQIEVYSMRYDDWEKTFVDKASTDPCGGRYICYVSSVIAGFITNQVKRFLKGQDIYGSMLFQMDSLDLLKS